MRRIFLDTAYLQALVDSTDDLHSISQEKTAALLGAFQSITSEMVLTELINALCSRGQYLRQAAVAIIQDLQNDPSVDIIPQTSEQFDDTFKFYQQRPDKGYSLTDCASMQIMRQMNMQEVLTFDKHFQQEGFIALLRE